MINTLFSTELAAVKEYHRRHVKQLDKTVEIDIIKAELEEKQFRIKLTVVDAPGFGGELSVVWIRGLRWGSWVSDETTSGCEDYVNNQDSWMPIIDFIDDQHESFMRQEQQPERTEKLDMRVHACLYFIRPTGHTYVFSRSSIR